MGRRQILKGGAALGVVSACPGPRRAAARTTRKRELVIVQGADLVRFDPHFNSGIRIPFNIFDTLVSRHPDGKIHPALATEWRRQGPTAWLFTLRQGVRWHNGDPFTSADVKFSVERTWDPSARTLVATVFGTFDRIETPDPRTVIIHTKMPDPLLLARLAFWGHVLPRKHVTSVGNAAFDANPVGTGPVSFVSATKGDKVVLQANPDYWGGRIDVDRVVFRPIPEVAPRLAALLAGEADIMCELPPDHVDRVAAHPSTKVVGTLNAGLYVLAVNSRRPPLDNPLIKQALSLAIDRETIVKELWRGRGVVPNGPIAKGDNHFDPTLPPLAYRPAEARERLRKAGYKNEPIVIETTVGYTANDKAMSEAIQAMWRDVGVNATVEVLEYSVRAQKNRDRTFKGLWWSDPTSTLGDPDGMMWRLLGPGAVQDYWRHPRFDELGRAAQISTDERLRGDAYREMTRILLEHLPWLPVVQASQDYGVQKHVEWTPNPNNQLDIRRFNLRLRRA